jgi:hypothetical protein
MLYCVTNPSPRSKPVQPENGAVTTMGGAGEQAPDYVLFILAVEISGAKSGRWYSQLDLHLHHAVQTCVHRHW